MGVDYKIKSHLKSTKILLVEDDAVMITLLRDVLVVMGFGEITLCKNGKEALEEFAASHFDLIFCDWRMKGVDGLEFTRCVRHHPDYSKCFTPIIMITGKGRQEDVEIARDAGVTEYIVKPFSIDSLCEKIKNIIEKPRPFVMGDAYKGPDRRRKNEPDRVPGSKDRRKNKHGRPDQYIDIELE